MTCVPGKIRTSWTDDAYTCSRAGLLWCEWEKRKVGCNICGASLAAASLPTHLETQHNVYQSCFINQDSLLETPSVTHRVSPSVTGKFECPVPGCQGGGVTKWNLRKHFQAHHPRDLVNIPGEGVYPKCDLCNMHQKKL